MIQNAPSRSFGLAQGERWYAERKCTLSLIISILYVADTRTVLSAMQ